MNKKFSSWYLKEAGGWGFGCFLAIWNAVQINPKCSFFLRHHICLLAFLKRLVSPSVEKGHPSSPTPERARKATPRYHRERNREQASENKENNDVQDRDVDIFALPPPRTPVSSKKNARLNKNVLTTPNQNANINSPKPSVATPKGKNHFLIDSWSLNQRQKIEYRQYRALGIVQFICTVIVVLNKGLKCSAY